MSVAVGGASFLVGLAAAVAAEISVGLLLYSGMGFLRALTLILATLMGSFALGMWSAPNGARGDAGRVSGVPVDAIRRRWLLVLLAYVGGAGTAGAWEFLGGLAGGGLSRGMGLALLAGFPLYGAGAVLGGLGSATGDDGEAAAERGKPPGGPSVGAPAAERGKRPGGPSVGAPAALGAAFGIVVTGLVLLPTFAPVTSYVMCLVLLSGGALLHGRELDRRTERRVLDEEMSAFGRVVVDEARRGGSRGREIRLLVEGDVRGGIDDEGRAIRGWERAVAGWTTGMSEGGPPGGPLGPRGGSVLLVGAGAVALLHAFLARERSVDLVEPDPVVRRMTMRHLGAPQSAAGLTVKEGGVGALFEAGAGPWDMVVVDGAAFAPHHPVPLPGPDLLSAARRALAPGGWIVLGGRWSAPLGTGEGVGFLSALATASGLGSLALYGDDAGALLILAAEKGAPFPPAVGDLGRTRLHL